MTESIAHRAGVRVVTCWPGAPLHQLLDAPSTVGLVTTAAMRAQLEGGSRRVLYPRELLAAVTTTPAWDDAESATRRAIARALRHDLDRFAHRDDDRVDVLDAMRHGRLWVNASVMDRLLGETESRAGGAPLPPLATRLRANGIDAVVVFEPDHRYTDTLFWRALGGDEVTVTFVGDSGHEDHEVAGVDTPQVELDGPLDLSEAVRNVLAASPARTDGPPPPALHHGGAVSLHRLDGADTADLPWVVASALISAGAAAHSTQLASLAIPTALEARTVLVVVAHRGDESTMRHSLSRHLAEPVVLLRTGRDDAACAGATAMLRAVVDDDPKPLLRAVLTRVAAVAPSALDEARGALMPLPTNSLTVWLSAAVDTLGQHRDLRPLAVTLTRLAARLDEGPRALLAEFAALVPLEATGRASRTGTGVVPLAPTVERAAAAASIDDALETLAASGWSPSRSGRFEPDAPRILVTSANRIGAVRTDVVVIVRPATRGFTGSMGFSARDNDTAQWVLYRCLGAARHSAHLIHRGADDLAWWAHDIDGVTVQRHDLSLPSPCGM